MKITNPRVDVNIVGVLFLEVYLNIKN